MSNSHLILVVDDDDAIREALADLLQEEGYCVIGAHDGSEALMVLRSRPLPCLILLDLMMPVMDGLSFLSEQQQDPQLAAIPVLVITAGTLKQVPAPSVRHVFSKPLKTTALLEAVASHC